MSAGTLSIRSGHTLRRRYSTDVPSKARAALALVLGVCVFACGQVVAQEKDTASTRALLAELSHIIDSAGTNKDRTMLVATLLRRSELLRELDRGPEAGMDERRALGLPYKHITANALPDYQKAANVFVEFAATNRESGLYVVEVGDSRHEMATVDGEPAWFFRGGWNYAYFFIDPTFKWQLGSNVVFRVEYQILGRNPIGIQYDAARDRYSGGAEIRREFQEPDSNWRVIEFRATDARLQNSQNGRADFRISDNEKGFYLRRVTVSRFQREPFRPRNPSLSPNLIDLSHFYISSLRIYMPRGDPDAVTNVLPLIQQATGVDFDVRGYIGLYRSGEGPVGTNTNPVSVKGIPIGRRVRQIHFLHAASYGEKDGQQIGSYVMNMSDGSLQEFAIVYGQNVCSERGDYRALPEAEVAWDGEGIRTGAGTRVRIYKVTWINSDPETPVKSIDFISTETKSAPHLLGITVEP